MQNSTVAELLTQSGATSMFHVWHGDLFLKNLLTRKLFRDGRTENRWARHSLVVQTTEPLLFTWPSTLARIVLPRGPYLDRWIATERF